MILIMQQRVRDYDAWKTVFDEGEPLRARHGCTGHEIFRDDDDGNAVTLHLCFATREAGESLGRDPEIAAAMARAGVEGPPTTSWAHDGEARTYAGRRAA